MCALLGMCLSKQGHVFTLVGTPPTAASEESVDSVLLRGTQSRDGANCATHTENIINMYIRMYVRMYVHTFVR